MKITDIAIGTISIPLITPFKTALRTVDRIEDLIVRITLDSGETFYAYCEGYKLENGLPSQEKINSDGTGYIPDYFLAIPDVSSAAGALLRRVSVVITFVLGAVFFHERNLRRKGIALTAILAGVVLLCL